VGHVSVYRIGLKGVLTPVYGSPFTAGFWPASVVADPSGRFIYVANKGANPIATETLSGYSIAGNGTLIPLKGSPFQEGGGTYSMCMDPLGRFLYLTDFFYDQLTEFRITNNGVPRRLSYYKGVSPYGPIVVDPFGRFVYVANSRTSATASFSGYRVANNGALTTVVGSPFQFLGAMVVDLTGQFLYVSNSHEDGNERTGLFRFIVSEETVL
jgi:6-phosphogluconolactonase (cycloisomerase 2 family)